MKFEFITSSKNPYRFSVRPPLGEKLRYTDEKIHLDTDYLLIGFMYENFYVKYLFDKNKNYIPWKQRAKEVENSPDEKKQLENGFFVKRNREVLYGFDYENGGELIIDRLYENKSDKYTIRTERRSEVTGITEIYQEYLADIKSREEHAGRRKRNQEIYLAPKTSQEDRLKILQEEVERYIWIFAYHFQFRGTDTLEKFAEYSEYEKYYFSQVENKKQMYVEFLKCYLDGFASAALDEYSTDEKERFIKEKCEKYGVKYDYW